MTAKSRVAAATIILSQAACGGSGTAPKTEVQGFGEVEFDVAKTNAIVELETTLTVPRAPPPSGTLFLWPGLQPMGDNFLPIDNGVLQSVLTWGPSCAPGDQPAAYSTWWVSAQYVNTFGHFPGYTGCQGGAIMVVQPSDRLRMTMRLQGSVWHQTVTRLADGQSVSFDIDMRAQAQNRALFAIEGSSQVANGDVLFTDTRILFSQPQVDACQPILRGQHDEINGINAGRDGLNCTIAAIVLRSN